MSSAPATMTVAEAVGRTLAALGAGHVFGVVGSGNFHATHALTSAGVPYVAARHEMGAATMADAYSRISGEVAIVSLHQGCGLTNAMTGIAEAAKCHTPLLVITGDTAAGDVTSNFFIEQDAAVAAVGAEPRRLHSAASAVRDATDAFRSAMHERRTVVLSMPVDIQEEEIAWSPDEVPAEPERHRAGASPETVERVAEMLRAAQRPVIVGGRGAREARDDLRALAEASGALLLTSAGARGLFNGDDWALDVMGGFATEGSADLVRESDLVVAFGAALNKWTTREGDLLRTTTTVHVDDRPEAFGLHRDVDVTVLGDAGAVAVAVSAALASLPRSGPGYRTPETAERVAASRHWSDQPFEPRREPGVVDPQELTNAIDRMLPAERVVVPDGGNVNCFAGAQLRVPDDEGFVMPLSFQAIGMGLSACIGAGVARPDRMPVVGTGDGAFMMAIADLDTAVRLGLGMLVIVFDDAAYGAEINLFRDEPSKHGIVRFPDTDIAAVARGFGCDACVVRGIDDLGPLEEWLSGPRTRPFVLDAKITSAPSWLMARRHH